MGNRITVKELMMWLSTYDPNSEVAFFVEGVGRDRRQENAYELKEITERGRCRRNSGDEGSESTILFLNVE